MNCQTSVVNFQSDMLGALCKLGLLQVINYKFLIINSLRKLRMGGK